jgi:hypothetical protein
MGTDTISCKSSFRQSAVDGRKVGSFPVFAHGSRNWLFSQSPVASQKSVSVPIFRLGSAKSVSVPIFRKG